MAKRVLIGAALVIVLAVAGLFFWSRAVFSSDTVRLAVADQLTTSLGQPVAIGSIGATIFPRVTMTLNDVTIGQPVRISAKTLHVGTDFRALLSRRIEHAALRLDSATIELPLPEFAFAKRTEATPPAEEGSAVQIVSVDEITLSNIDVISGGRTLHGDIEVVPQGAGVLVKRIALKADDTSLDITGEITDLSGPVGTLNVKAGDLNFVKILAFVSEFSTGASPAGDPTSASVGPASPTSAGNVGPASLTSAGNVGPASPTSAGNVGPGLQPRPAPTTPSTMNITVALDADRATFNDLQLEHVTGRASVTGNAVVLDPISFTIFGGGYQGALNLSLDATPAYEFRASIKSVDIAKAMAFAGTPDTVTGRLAGTINLSGRGLTADEVLRTTKGTMRFDATDGTVKNLGLLRGVVLATSMRGDSRSQIASTSTTEPFSRFGATLTIQNGTASTTDLKLESRDLILSATGSMKLDGSAINLAGPLQLSDDLSAQAGRDLVRYTQQQGRVTLPAKVSGSLDQPKVSIDVGDMAKRAITNRANEEAQKAVGRGLGRLLGGK